MISFLLIFFRCVVYGDDTDDFPHVEMTEMEMGDLTFIENAFTRFSDSASLFESTENPFEGSELDENFSWVKAAVKDVLFYLRSYKFNEYDQRYVTNESVIKAQYFVGFSKSPLRSLHWEVHTYCDISFLSCLEYLHRRIKKFIFKRQNDTSVLINKNNWTIFNNLKQIKIADETCQSLKNKNENNFSPFTEPVERLKWQTTASYYMCWHTMNSAPDLEYLGEPCDNFASCLDPKYGANNLDPRASDAKPFFCALYSLCPDPCCPLRHIANNTSCWNNTLNPCYNENQHAGAEKLQCLVERYRNTDFRDIVLNRWNVTCQCPKAGYIWESRYGMCVDVNECSNGEHNCDETIEVCLNLPGSFRCICNWGYDWNKKKNQCIKLSSLTAVESVKINQENKNDSVVNFLFDITFSKLFLKSFSTKMSCVFFFGNCFRIHLNFIPFCIMFHM